MSTGFKRGDRVRAIGTDIQGVVSYIKEEEKDSKGVIKVTWEDGSVTRFGNEGVEFNEVLEVLK